MSLSGYQILLIAFISILMGAIGAYYVKGKIDTVELDKRLETQKTDDQRSCKEDKDTTVRYYDGLHQKEVDTNKQLHAFLDMYGMYTVYPTSMSITNAPTKRNGATKSGKSVRSHGIPAQALINLAGEAERYRLQLISCQGFITDVWKAKGQ